MSMIFWLGRAEAVEDELVNKLVEEARKAENYGGVSIYSQTDVHTNAPPEEYLVVVLTSADKNFQEKKNKVVEAIGLPYEKFEQDCSQVPTPEECLKFSSQQS